MDPAENWSDLQADLKQAPARAARRQSKTDRRTDTDARAKRRFIRKRQSTKVAKVEGAKATRATPQTP